MPHQARLDVPGTLHHVMIRGIETPSIFNGDQDRQDSISTAVIGQQLGYVLRRLPSREE